MRTPNNLEVDTFPDPVGHFGGVLGQFLLELMKLPRHFTIFDIFADPISHFGLGGKVLQALQAVSECPRRR